MIRRFAVSLVVVFCTIVAPAQAQESSAAAALKAAFGAMAAENWDAATQDARASGALGRDLVEWSRLRAGQGDWAGARAFLARRPDWPGLRLLRRKAEATLPENAAPGDVLAYFGGRNAQTGTGALALAAAYAASGKTDDARAEVVQAWRRLSLSAPERAAFLAQYGRLLKPHHAARLAMLVRRGLSGEAQAMAPLVSPGQVALATARLALQQNKNGVDALIRAVPAGLQNDAGLAYDRFLWRFRKGRNIDAAQIILARSKTDGALGEPMRWANGRRQLARALMRDGKARMAYQVAANHHLRKGSSYADLEWLSGYLALRSLNEPALALVHFQRFREAVKSPISLVRAGYWLGRTREALGQPEQARTAYVFGARYQTSFYGQLAAERAGLAMDPALTGQEVHADWRNAPFLKSGILQAAVLLHEAGEERLATRFLLHLERRLTNPELGPLADFALALPAPYSALMIAKQAARRGVVLPRAYYPMHPIGAQNLPVAPELALAIARRESEFNPEVISGVGARGLMQLMPRTAKLMSGELDLVYDSGRLLTDWRYNARLGSAYLAKLQGEFGPSPLLVAAAYNAGPSRVRRWLKALGDPREGGSTQVDVVDWIEQIPFRETRNYVMRVAESLPIYRARLAGKPQPLRLLSELAGG